MSTTVNQHKMLVFLAKDTNQDDLSDSFLVRAIQQYENTVNSLNMTETFGRASTEQPTQTAGNGMFLLLLLLLLLYC